MLNKNVKSLELSLFEHSEKIKEQQLDCIGILDKIEKA